MKNLGRKARRLLRHAKIGQALLYVENRFKKNSYVLSYPKCGRTWAATVIMHYVGKYKGVITEPLPFSVNPNRDHPELFVLGRKAVFSHDIMTARISPEKLDRRFSVSQYANKPIVFIVRDPRDVVVSYFHHIKQRREKTNLREGTTLDDFVHMPEFGLARIVTLYNKMYRFSELKEDIEFFRYEDLRGAGAYNIDTWKAMLSFIFKEPVDSSALQWALDASGFEQMKRREDKDDTLNPEARRVRKGEVGGYKGEMSPETRAYVDQYIEDNLHDFYRLYKHGGTDARSSE